MFCSVKLLFYLETQQILSGLCSKLSYFCVVVLFVPSFTLLPLPSSRLETQPLPDHNLWTVNTKYHKYTWISRLMLLLPTNSLLTPLMLFLSLFTNIFCCRSSVFMPVLYHYFFFFFFFLVLEKKIVKKNCNKTPSSSICNLF